MESVPLGLGSSSLACEMSFLSGNISFPFIPEISVLMGKLELGCPSPSVELRDSQVFPWIGGQSGAESSPSQVMIPAGFKFRGCVLEMRFP